MVKATLGNQPSVERVRGTTGLGGSQLGGAFPVLKFLRINLAQQRARWETA